MDPKLFLTLFWLGYLLLVWLTLSLTRWWLGWLYCFMVVIGLGIVLTILGLKFGELLLSAGFLGMVVVLIRLWWEAG